MNVWITSTISGFLHPDITFDVEWVDRPVVEQSEQTSIGETWFNAYTFNPDDGDNKGKDPELNNQIEEDSEVLTEKVQQAISPESVLLAMSTASGSMYIVCLLIYFLCFNCKKWCHTWRVSPEETIDVEELYEI